MNTPLLLTGIGLRTPHHTEFITKRPKVAWLEVHSENFFAEGGKALHTLDAVRADYPISLHGVSLSLGSSDDLNWQHLKKLRDLSARIHPCLISDHLSWSSIDGRYLHDLLPLPYTDESLNHIVERIQQVQDYLQKQILIENISSYVRFESSTIPEWEFLQETAKRSGCGILLDVNNIYVSATNLGFNPITYLMAISPNHVQEIHLGGFAHSTIGDKEVLIDSHNHPVVPAVWDLYRKAIQHLGVKPTIIEWDSDLPTLETLCLEAFRAEQIMRETYAAAKLTG
jgi:hypothetical protein